MFLVISIYSLYKVNKLFINEINTNHIIQNIINGRYFDSPDFLISKNHLKKFGFFKKIFYLILGFILGVIHNHFKGTLFTVLINFFLRKKVKLKYEKPFYVGVEGDLKFYFPNKRVTRLLEGIEKQTKDIFELYMLDKIEFNSGDTVVDCGANVGELYKDLKKY